MLSSALARDARVAGIRSEATLAAVQRRRIDLFSVLLIALVALCVATAIAPAGFGGAPVDAGILRIGLVALSATFVLYALEKERALRRLEAALRDESRRREVVEAESDRLHGMVSIGHAISASLELDRVVDLSLSAAVRMFGADGGAVFLDRGDLVVQAVHGTPSRLDLIEAHAREVAAAGEAGLFGDGAEGMASPLIHEGTLVGVLVVHGNEEQSFQDADVAMLREFSRTVASAITNARLFRAEQVTNQNFTGLHDARDEFNWLTAIG
ncbi:MAG TPA: GAF domain-containing protein [Acidimicrobiia bacterium]|nr:GAF domain-containing protein [Acidimicrobiia bacterium]